MLGSSRQPIDKAGLTTLFSSEDAFPSVYLLTFINDSKIKRMKILLKSQDEC